MTGARGLREALQAAVGDASAWLVGGAVRDDILGRPTDDLDVATTGDPQAVASALRAALGGAAFPLGDTWGGWRVVGPRQRWQVDVLRVQGGSLEADLLLRDFTVNAMAQPLDGGEVVDPTGGWDDLDNGILRVVGPGSVGADPVRAIRAVRFAAELGLTVEPPTLELVRAAAPRLDAVAVERVFAELKRIVCVPEPVPAMRLLETAGVTAVVLPELLELHGVDQSVYHHRDVHDHTLEVLDAAARLQADPAAWLGEAGADAARAALGAPLADGLDGWGGLRFAALLHDIAKPVTAHERADGRGTGFPGHDAAGAEVARTVLRRLRASTKLQDFVAALTREHLRLGFLVHRRPLDRRTVHAYLLATTPWTVATTVLTVADRLATRGRGAEPAIEAHLEVAREVLVQAAEPERKPFWRGDELARELGIRPGPQLGELLAQLAEDRHAGAIASREDALARARELLDTPTDTDTDGT